MTTLLKLQEGPQKLMQKRNKRVLDYARFKALKDRGEKPDKKTVEQGEQFNAINETLKDELPKLFSLTKKLVEACLSNFVQLQLQWQIVWRRKLSQAIDDCKVKGPSTVSEIVESFNGDFSYSEAQVIALGICNGSMLADAVNLVNFLSPTTTLNGDGTASPRHASSLDLTKRRTLSISSDASPMLPQPDFGTRGNATFFGVDGGLQLGSGAYMPSNTIESNRRMRASSTVSSHGPRTPEMPGAYRSYSNSNTPGSNTVRPTTAITRTTTEPSPSLSRQSLENSNLIRSSEDPGFAGRPPSGSTYPQPVQNLQQRVPSPAARYSGFFSSAMPMSDSPPTESPTDVLSGVKEFVVIFLAASVYEFNIDRARREAGYPYLTYVAGEVGLPFAVNSVLCTDTFPRSSTSSAKKANFGSPRIKTTPPTRSAGYGTSTLSNWHRNCSAPKAIISCFARMHLLFVFLSPSSKPCLQCFRILITYPAFARQYRILRLEKARSWRFRSFVPQAYRYQVKPTAKISFSSFLILRVICFGEFYFII